MTGWFRLAVSLIALFIIGSVMVSTFGASYVAAERAEEVGKEAIRAQREADLNRQLAKEGWGYQAGSEAFGQETESREARRSRRNQSDDWGTRD